MKNNNQKIAKTVLVVAALILISVGIIKFIRKDQPQDITWQTLEIVLEYDQEKQNEKQDDLIASVIIDHLGKNMNMETYEVDQITYNLTKITQVEGVYGKVEPNEIKEKVSESVSKKEAEAFQGKAKISNEKKHYEIKFDYSVIDSQAPHIEVEQDLVTNENQPLNLLDHISAYDDVDGVIEDIKIQGDIAWEKPGNYQLEAIVSDKHGNQTSEDFEVLVKSTQE